MMFHLNLFGRICLASLLLVAASACANEPASLYLKDGRTLTGSVAEFTKDALIWKGADGNRQEIPLIDVERLEFSAEPSEEPPAEPSAEPPESEPVELESRSRLSLDPPPPQRFVLRDDPFLSLVEEVIGGVSGVFGGDYENALQGLATWTQRLELGARFRDGNSEEDFIDVGSKLERKDSDRTMSFEFGGQYARANEQPTANRWFGNVTVDLSREGNWILFVANRNEFDEFENLDYRGTAAGGFGYRFFNEKTRRFILRLGPGVTYQKFHDPKVIRTTPDLLAEVEFQWPLFDRTQFEHKTTVTPNLEDFQVFRLQSNYGIVVRLDEDERWSLKFGLQHDYNSRPNVNNKPSDYMTGIRLLYELK